MIATIGVLMSLNDPQWGNRGNDNGNGRRPNQGPPDLDELWRDFNQRLSGMLGKKRGGGSNGGGNGKFEALVETGALAQGALDGKGNHGRKIQCREQRVPVFKDVSQNEPRQHELHRHAEAGDDEELRLVDFGTLHDGEHYYEQKVNRAELVDAKLYDFTHNCFPPFPAPECFPRIFPSALYHD